MMRSAPFVAAVVLALALLGSLLVRTDANIFHLGKATAAVLVGAFLGGRYRLWLSAVQTWRALELNRQKSWTGAFGGVIVGLATISAWPVAHPELTVVAATMGPICLCYATMKLGCGYWGCCDWPTLDRPPLPYVEAVTSGICGMLLTGAYLCAICTDEAIIRIGCAVHGTQRVASLIARDFRWTHPGVLAFALVALLAVVPETRWRDRLSDSWMKQIGVDGAPRNFEPGVSLRAGARVRA